MDRKKRLVLKESLAKKIPVRIVTRKPDNAIHHGIVIHLSRTIVILQEISELKFDGILILPLNNISKLRCGKVEHAEIKVMKATGNGFKSPRLPWLKKANTIKDVLSFLSARNYWPIVETKAALYLGPILSTGKTFFDLYCYDAEGKWEKEYTLPYNEIIRIIFLDSYSEVFNEYMRKQLPPKEYRSPSDLKQK